MRQKKILPKPLRRLTFPFWFPFTLTGFAFLVVVGGIGMTWEDLNHSGPIALFDNKRRPKQYITDELLEEFVIGPGEPVYWKLGLKIAKYLLIALFVLLVVAAALFALAMVIVL